MSLLFGWQVQKGHSLSLPFIHVHKHKEVETSKILVGFANVKGGRLSLSFKH